MQAHALAGRLIARWIEADLDAGQDARHPVAELGIGLLNHPAVPESVRMTVARTPMVRSGMSKPKRSPKLMRPVSTWQ